MNIARNLRHVHRCLALCPIANLRLRSISSRLLRPAPSQLLLQNDVSQMKFISCSFVSQANPRINKVKPVNDLLDELKGDVLAYHRVHLDRVNQILVNPADLSAESYNFLLSCCGKLLLDHPVEARINIFKNIWFMANRGVEKISLDRWKIWLRVYCENAMDLDGGVQKFLAEVAVEKDQEFYELLLRVVCESGDVPKMWEVMELLKAQGLGVNVNIASALLRGHAKAGDLEAMKTVLDTMSAGNIEPNEEVYGELIVGWMRNNQTEKALKLISEKGRLLKEIHVSESLKEALVSGNKEATKRLLKLLPAGVIQDTNIDPIIRNICSELFREGQFDSVRALLNELPVPKFNLNENYDSYAVSLIFEMVKANVPLEELVLLVEFLVKTERNTRALHVACECAAKHCIDIYPELLGILKQQEDLRPHYFWPLIVQNFAKNGEVGVMDVLKLMQRFRTELDLETISVFVLPKLAISLKDVRILLKQFEDRGVRMSLLMTPLLSHLLYQNRFEDVLNVIKRYPTKIDTESLIYPLVLQNTVNNSDEHFRTMSEVVQQLKERAQNPKHDLAGQVLMELISNKKTKHDASTIKSMLDQLLAQKIRISRMCANVLKNHFSKANQINAGLDKLINSLIDDKLTIPSKEMFDSITVHPRDMGYEELECHLSELEDKKLNCRGVLRRLLQICVRENRLERAMEIKQKCDDYKVELSSGMLASVFDLHIRRKNVDDAGKTFQQIKSMYPGFLLDEHKVIDFAALLAEKGFLSNARNVLKQRATAQVRGGNTVNRNIWNLLTNTAKWAAENEPNSEKNYSKEMLDFLVDLKYCGYDNTLLGPVLREYLLKNQIRNAVHEYRKIATEKRRTPLQLEIFTTLVRLTNAADPEIPPEEAKALLGEVIKIGSKIHGSVNTNNTLIVALADGGTEAQLRRILINPETRVNHEYILAQCEFLISSGKLDVVLRLAKCSRGLANVREADFLAVILKQYIRDNNCEAAVELFNRLQSEDGDLKISGDFARKLIDLLEVNNYEVPNAVRLYAK